MLVWMGDKELKRRGNALNANASLRVLVDQMNQICILNSNGDILLLEINDVSMRICLIKYLFLILI